MLAAAAATTAFLAASPTVTAADPGGGTSWTARLADASGKRECAVVRRGTTNKGRFCAVLGPTQPFQYTVRYETPPETENWRSIVVITFARNVERATLQTPDGNETYRKGRSPRVMLVVLAGKVEQGQLEAVARVGRKRYTARAGRARTAEVADPLGGAGWRTEAANSATAKRVCVTWKRAPLRFGGTAPTRTSGREQCARAAGVAPVRAVETVDGRKVVYGLVGDGVIAVSLRTAAGEPGPEVAFDRRTRSYIAVVADSVDLTGLQVRLTRSTGTTEVPAEA